MTAMMWFRNDLRISDNPALYNATELNEGTVAIYIHCRAYIIAHSIAPSRLDFVRRNLQVLKGELAKKGILLNVCSVESVEDIAPMLLAFAKANAVTACFFNAEYPHDELERDRAVYTLLTAEGICVKRSHDRVIFPPGSIRNGSGEPYKIFTAFKRKWISMVETTDLSCLPSPKLSPINDNFNDDEIDTVFAQDALNNLSLHWPAGEATAQHRLNLFLTQNIDNYKSYRDIPSYGATSGLSPYLTIGAISVRQCLVAVKAYTQGDWLAKNEGVSCWVSELIWREFYQHVVVDYPQVCKHKAMQQHTEAFPWRGKTPDFIAWCEARTGIPIVDAAMRQLLTTGWMHNRLRMVVAMFLTKNLQVDWRLGEAFFMQHLIDGDFAANNGGWQWSASTGTDAAPYFRIFNPISQSERFDPNAEFIRKWLPELAHLSNKQIHTPPAMATYPAAIVDLSVSRKSTIALFAELNSRP